VRLTQLLSLVLTDSASERVRKNHERAIKELQAEVRRLDSVARRFPIVFGCRSLHETATRFLTPAATTVDGVASSNEQSIPLHSAGRLVSIAVSHPNTAGNGEDVRYQVHVNGTDTDLFLDLATGAVGSAFLTRARAVSARDLVSISATPQGTGIGSAAAVQPVVVVEVAI
jgi:hypothetical protein